MARRKKARRRLLLAVWACVRPGGTVYPPLNFAQATGLANKLFELRVRRKK